MFTDESKSSSLARFLNGFDYAIVDTCSLMEDSFPEWMDILANAKEYLAESLHIIVLSKCVEELEKHAKDKTDDTRRIAAKRAIKILRLVKRKKILEFPKKEKNQNFADNVIYTTVSNLRISKRCLIITQDKGLATDLKKLNELSSQRGRLVSVYKLVSGGHLEVNRGEVYGNKPYQGHQKYEAKKDFAKNNAKPIQNSKPVSNEAKPKAPVLTAQQKELITKDLELNSKLHNSNYPVEKKIADINAQISLINACKDVKAVKLAYSLEDLLKELLSLPVPAKKEEKKADVPAETKKIEPKKEEKKESPKPAPAPTKKLWYEYGSSVEGAIRHIAEHHGILIRDRSIPFFPQIHGEHDFTDLDLLEVVSNVMSGKSPYRCKGMTFIVEKSEKGYKAMIDFDEPTPVKVEAPAYDFKPMVAEVLAKLDEQPKADLVAKPTKKAEPKKPAPEKVEPAPKKQPAKKAKTSKEEAKPTKPMKATLVVAIPDDEKKAAEIERKVSRPVPIKKPTKKLAPKKAEEEPNPVKEAEPTSAPVAPKAKKQPAKKAKPEVKPVAKTEETKPAEKKPAKTKKEAKPVAEKAESAPAKKPAAPKKVSETKSPFDEAKAAEKVLMANISNPNYPVEKKKASLSKQIDLIAKVDPSERSKLSYTIDALKAMLAILG